MTAQWLCAVDVGDVDDQAVADAQGGRGGLREEQGRLEVGTHQVVPVDLGDVTQGGRIERRRVVDEDVEGAEVAGRYLGQHLQLTDVQQIRLDEHHGVGPCPVQLLGDGFRRFAGASVVENDVRTRSMQLAHDRRAYSACGPCDQRGFAGQRARFVWIGWH